MKLGTSERICLAHLVAAYQVERIYTFKNIASFSRLSVPIVKRAVRRLARKGLASLEFGMDEDGVLQGRGYMATKAGNDIIMGDSTT